MFAKDIALIPKCTIFIIHAVSDWHVTISVFKALLTFSVF